MTTTTTTPSDHFTEGTIPFPVPQTPTPCHTSYKLLGSLDSPHPRLIILHGGPGTGHEYMLPFARLHARHQLPLLLYDQLGCGASTHLPATHGDESLWRVSTFVRELRNLIDALRLADGPGYHLLGHSWGARVAVEFATTRPPGLRRLVLASGIASTETFLQGLGRIREVLPEEAREALREGEETGDFESAAFKGGMQTFFASYFVRAKPFPPKELLPAFSRMGEDKTVRETVSGTNPLGCTGSSRDWTCIPDLPRINVPTLVYNGEFDTSHDVTVAPFFEHIPRVRWITFADAGHMCHLEGPELREKVLRTVGEFLTQGE